jgi:hypothetical protein
VEPCRVAGHGQDKAQGGGGDCDERRSPEHQVEKQRREQCDPGGPGQRRERDQKRARSRVRGSNALPKQQHECTNGHGREDSLCEDELLDANLIAVEQAGSGACGRDYWCQVEVAQ